MSDDGVRFDARHDTVRQRRPGLGVASEILKSEPDLRGAITEGFARWTADFRGGLQAMQARGELSADADLDRLVHVLATAFQGGMLLAQAQGDVAPLRDALAGAIDAVRASAPRPDPAERVSAPAS